MTFSLANLPPGSESAANVADCKVFINSEELGGEVLLLNASVRKSFNKIAGAKLVFRDGNVADQNFSLSNDDRFKPGGEISIQLGFNGASDSVFEGIIVRHNIKIRPDGRSFLMIEAKDKAIKLAGARKSKFYVDMTDSDVIEEIVGASGLECDVQNTPQSNKQLVQYDSTDWDFIATRAEANGMLVLTDDGAVKIFRPDSQRPPATLVTYGANLLDFEAEMDARLQFQNVSANTWDYSGQQIESSDSGIANFEENGNISSEELSNILGIEKKLVNSGKMEAGQLRDWADAFALRSKVAKSAGRFRIKGNAELKPGNVISIQGVGARFNGNVFVTGIRHTYDGNWLTEVQFGWTEDSFYKKDNVMDKPASGLVPGISGLQIGVVQDIDDPENQFRIKVTIPPSTTSRDGGIWARVATLDAGDNRGTYFRPKVGDEVILGFLNDDPQSPVILGCLHSNDSKKSPLPETRGNEEYGFVSGADSKLIFNDTEKKVVISVNASDGEKTLVLNDSGTITLKDGLGNKLVMDASGITIEASANIVIKGTLVQIN